MQIAHHIKCTIGGDALRFAACFGQCVGLLVDALVAKLAPNIGIIGAKVLNRRVCGACVVAQARLPRITIGVDRRLLALTGAQPFL